jgi:transcriptional regulator GlxA family with amidase domain
MGALFLGASGILDGLKATTHHLFLDELRAVCRGTTEVVQARYVDGGYGNNGLRIITGGGVSSALDAACYLVSEIFSPGMALFATEMVEFTWKPL